MLPKAIKILRPPTAVCAMALAILSTVANSRDIDIAVAGPVDSVDCDSKVVRILGIEFQAIDRSTAAWICGSHRHPGLTYVTATGQLNARGQVDLISSRVISVDGYVAGSSAVYLKGRVTEAALFAGKVLVSGATVNTSGGTPAVGSTIELVGIQPLLGGEILPESLAISNSSKLLSSTGSGKLSSTGSGTERLSSTGSGVAALSSTGSGFVALSSTGSGVAKLSSTGSGSEKRSSTGSGTARLSSTGSGVAALSSTGSGVAKLSSTGSGSEKRSSTGSGVARLSSTGSGVAARSSTGSGVAKLSSTGSGVN